MGYDSVPKEVGKQDTITVHVSGVKGGAPARGGLPTVLASETMSLAHMLETWGSGVTDEPPEIDTDALREAAAKGSAYLEEALAKVGQKLVATSSGATALPDRIQAAVFSYLSSEKNILVSESDPGDDVWYVNPGDFKFVVQKHPADGYQWFVTLAAPFG